MITAWRCRARSDLADQAAGDLAVELSIHGLQGDVAEAGRGAARYGRFFVEQFEDAGPPALGVDGVAVVAGDAGQCGLLIYKFEDGDVDAGDDAAAVGAAVVLPLSLPGDRRAELAGADAGMAGWEEAGQDAPADDADGAGFQNRDDSDGLDSEATARPAGRW